MKKLLWIMAGVLIGTFSQETMAQGRATGRENMNVGQLMEKRAGRLADELKLEGVARDSFIVTYKNYQEELMAHRRVPERMAAAENNGGEMTEEEAAVRLKTVFDNKAQDIVDAYNRLEVDKKYYAEFSKSLSSVQLLKIFAPMRAQRQADGRRGRMPRMSNGGGNPFQSQGFGEESDW